MKPHRDKGEKARSETASGNMVEVYNSEEWLIKNRAAKVDVLIIGTGFAGLTAAIEAKNAGASVIILEKMKSYGGNSIISGGLVAAAGSPQQEKAGINDSPQLMLKDMLAAGLGLNYPELALTVAENSNEAVQWTSNYLGVKYKEELHQLGGHSVPRTYATHNNSGSAIVKKLVNKIKEQEIIVKTQMYLEKIIQGGDGRVNGVVAREGYVFPRSDSGVPQYIQARKAVILATGGFASDISFRKTQDPRLNSEVDSTNKLCTTAEALKCALNIGATPVQLSCIQLGPWASPDEKMMGAGADLIGLFVFPYGVVIDPATGKRFVNELADRKTRTDAFLKVGQPCIGIADRKGVEKSGYRIDHCLKKGVVKKFGQFEELAAAYSIPFETLKRTINSYNRYVKNKLDEAFGKPILPEAKPLITPPYYGIRLWPKVHHTMGGIQINAKAQVIGLNCQPIKGLYAAGEITAGIHGASRLGSCAISDCLVFGRIAGKNAAMGEMQLSRSDDYVT